MRVKVVLERERGVYRPSYGHKDTGTGDLHLTYRSVKNRRVAVLQLLGAERKFPNLYDPKLIELSATQMRFVGSEPVDNAWVMQEWICELLPA